MVNEDYLKRLQEEVDRICVKVGIDVPVKIENVYYQHASIYFKKDIGNKYANNIDLLVEELKSVEGVKCVYDCVGNRKLRGGEVRDVSVEVEDGLWTESQADDEAVERECEDEDLEAVEAERRANYLDYIIPIPPPPKKWTDELYLTMAYEPYDHIKDGYIDEADGEFKRKTTEFRRYTESWVKKILSHPLKTVRFQRGYGGPGRPKPEQMVWTVKGITLYDSSTRKECSPDKIDVGFIPDFIAIDLGEHME